MGKNVVLCCDGTANEFTRDKTNVVKLFYTLVHHSADQRTYYHPGLGTMEATGAITMVGRKFTKLLGKAIGYGLEADIRDAYVFLMIRGGVGYRKLRRMDREPGEAALYLQ